MGSSASTKLANKEQELKKLKDQAEKQIEIFKAWYTPQIGNDRLVTVESDIRICSKTETQIPKSVDEALKQQSWGSAGNYAKKHITQLIENLVGNSGGSITEKKGYNLIATTKGELSKIVWLFYSREISAKAWGQEKMESVFTYYYASYQMNPKDQTVTSIKSLLLGSNLDEEDRDKCLQVLLCDLFGKCPKEGKESMEAKPISETKI